MKPQAIETRYKGYRFRSRLEARWAVFFDALGIRWKYEIEGYRLHPYYFDDEEWSREQSKHIQDVETLKLLPLVAAGMKYMASKEVSYLPDFWLTDLDTWAEVKGGGGIQDFDKMIRLVNQSQKKMLVLKEVDDQVMLLSPLDAQRNLVTIEEFYPSMEQARVSEAINAARSARFEHGEKPRIPKDKRRR